MNYFVVLNINGEDTFYEVSRGERRFLLDYFSNPKQITDHASFWDVESRKRTQYETQYGKGKKNKIPESLRQALYQCGFPLEELQAKVWKLGDKIVTTIHADNPRQRRKELFEKGAVPYKTTPGDIIFNHENNKDPIGRVGER